MLFFIFILIVGIDYSFYLSYQQFVLLVSDSRNKLYRPNYFWTNQLSLVCAGSSAGLSGDVIAMKQYQVLLSVYVRMCVFVGEVRDSALLQSAIGCSSERREY